MQKTYRENNKEKLKESYKKYYEKNKENILLSKKKYYREHKKSFFVYVSKSQLLLWK